MGYRGTHEQLEARWAALPSELEAMHDELIAASKRVEVVRRSEWGALGVWWFRFTLRRALRDVDTGARWDHRTQRGLARAVQQHERALAQGRAVIRWLEESVTPRAEPLSVEPPPRQRSSPAIEWVRDVLAVIGAGARASWIVARPMLIALGVVAMIMGRLDPRGVFGEYPDAAEPRGFGETPDQRRASDVRAGLWTVGTLGLLGGALAWWVA